MVMTIMIMMIMMTMTNRCDCNLPLVRSLHCCDPKPDSFSTVLFCLANLVTWHAKLIGHVGYYIMYILKVFPLDLIVILCNVDNLQIFLLISWNHQRSTKTAAMLVSIPVHKSWYIFRSPIFLYIWTCRVFNVVYDSKLYSQFSYTLDLSSGNM